MYCEGNIKLNRFCVEQNFKRAWERLAVKGSVLFNACVHR